jgi:hypothetical protein
LLDSSRHSRGEQFFLGTEVMDKAVNADFECRSHRPQRRLRQPVLRQVLDDAIEQFLTTLEIGCSRHGRTLTAGRLQRLKSEIGETRWLVTVHAEKNLKKVLVRGCL